MPTTTPAATSEPDLATRIPCECMVCDLPLEAAHGPVEFRLGIWFPGPYPLTGETEMLLCAHCTADWRDSDWEPPLDNFVITHLTRI